MTKIFYCSPALILLLSSCEFDDNGDASISGFGWFLIFGIIFMFIIMIIKTNKESKESKIKMKEKGMDYSQFVPLGTYAGGHPSINETVENTYCRKEEANLALYQIAVTGVSMPEKIIDATIPTESISNISIEDASSIEKKITVGRIFLVGIFALGWRKKKKNELAFLVVEWEKGKFEHSTTFSFEGKDAFQNANTARNRLIAFCE